MCLKKREMLVKIGPVIHKKKERSPMLKEIALRRSFLDVAFVCDGGRVLANKFFVAAQSEAMRRRLEDSSDQEPDNSSAPPPTEVNMAGVRVEHMKRALKFMYGGKIYVRRGDMEMLLEVRNILINIFELPVNFPLKNLEILEESESLEGDSFEAEDSMESQEKETSLKSCEKRNQLEEYQEVDKCLESLEKKRLESLEKKHPESLKMDTCLESLKVGWAILESLESEESRKSLESKHLEPNTHPGVISLSKILNTNTPDTCVLPNAPDTCDLPNTPDTLHLPNTLSDAMSVSTSENNKPNFAYDLISLVDQSSCGPIQTAGDKSPCNNVVPVQSPCLSKSPVDQSRKRRKVISKQSTQRKVIRKEELLSQSMQLCGIAQETDENLPTKQPTNKPKAGGNLSNKQQTNETKAGGNLPNKEQTNKPKAGVKAMGVRKYKHISTTITGITKKETLEVLKAESGIFACDESGCIARFQKYKSLQVHKSRKHNPNLTIPCPFPECQRKLASTTALKKHRLTHIPESEWPIWCPFCKKRFQARGDLPKHLKTKIHIKDMEGVVEGSEDWRAIIFHDKQLNNHSKSDVAPAVPSPKLTDKYVENPSPITNKDPFFTSTANHSNVESQSNLSMSETTNWNAANYHLPQSQSITDASLPILMPIGTHFPPPIIMQNGTHSSSPITMHSPPPVIMASGTHFNNYSTRTSLSQSGSILVPIQFHHNFTNIPQAEW